LKFKKYIFIFLKVTHYIFRITALILLTYGLTCSIIFDGKKLAGILPNLALIMALAVLLAYITDLVFLPLIKYLKTRNIKGSVF